MIYKAFCGGERGLIEPLFKLLNLLGSPKLVPLLGADQANHVVNHCLAAFNSVAIKRDSKWKLAKNADDLTKLKEFEFLNILETISVIGKIVKQELQQCLQLRNACGHPNSLKIGERKVAAHIEILILNVLSKF